MRFFSPKWQVALPLTSAALLIASVTDPPAGITDSLFAPQVVIDDQTREAVTVTVGDIDGDGDTDGIAIAATARGLFWFENVRGPIEQGMPRHSIGAPFGPWGVSTGDIDGDGHLDVLTAATRGGNLIQWWENDGASSPQFVSHEVFTTTDNGANGSRMVIAADLDGDGDLDLISCSDENNRVWWHENSDPDGDGSEWITWTVASPDGAWGVDAADVDGDGDIDVLSAARDAATIAWHMNNGATPPSFTTRLISEGETAARSVHAVDLDQDGDVDVIHASRDNNTVAWHESDGADPPSFTRHVINNGAAGAYWVRSADFDLDGDIDVIAAHPLEGLVAWHENLGGSPLSFVEHELTVPGGQALMPASAMPGDFDGDGDLDILSSGGFDSEEVHVYENLLFTSPISVAGGTFVDVSGDGINQPGEPGTLLVTVANSSEEAVADVRVRVSTDSPHVHFEQVSAELAAVSGDATATVTFDYTTAADVECGALLSAAISVEWDGGSAHRFAAPEPFGGDLLFAIVATSEVNLWIPDDDPEGISGTIRVPELSGTIRAVRVVPLVIHPRRGDLLLTLTHPNGNTVTVFAGDPADGESNVEGVIDVPGLEGFTVGGDHTLRAVDRFPGEVGDLIRWRLEIEFAQDLCTPWSPDDLLNALLGIGPMRMGHDLNADGRVDAADLTLSVMMIE